MKILVFEDSPNKMQSVEELLNLKLSHEFGMTISMVIHIDDATLETELLTNDFALVLIDDDLGDNLSGENVIEKIIEIIDSTPECRRLPLIYYSAGTTVEDLKLKSKRFGMIQCVSFENLTDVVYTFVKSRR